MLCLLNSLKGYIPYHIYGGAYTEPTLNPYLLSCVSLTKKYNNHFGIHTNGTMLNTLEQDIGFLTEIDRLATDEEDYISISLDGGLASSWGDEKSSRRTFFYEILEGIQRLTIKRNNSHKNYSIRLCYLLNEANSSQENIDAIVAFARHIKVDSLRFSIPYGTYLQSFDKLEKYKSVVEDRKGKTDYFKVHQYLTIDKNIKPYIFFVSPETTNVTNYNFNSCIYHAYQITAGADGYYYKCSAVAAPDAKEHRLGKITDSLQDFKNAIDKNKNDNETWDCKKQCFDKGLRCNRMAIELNQEYKNKRFVFRE